MKDETKAPAGMEGIKVSMTPDLERYKILDLNGQDRSEITVPWEAFPALIEMLQMAHRLGNAARHAKGKPVIPGMP
jgi:hypothetical protein